MIVAILAVATAATVAVTPSMMPAPTAVVMAGR